MKIIKILFPLFFGIIGFLILTETLLGMPVTNTAVSTSDSVMVEYTIPMTMTGGINGEPHKIIVQEPGHSWFTLPASNQIGELIVTSTVDYQFYLYTIPVANSEPYDLVYDGENIWFTAKAVNQIGQLDLASRTISTHTIPTANSMPTGITQAPDGRIWFVNSASNKLAFFAPATPDIITEYPITCISGTPPNLQDIAITQSDSIWLTAPDCNRVFEFQPSTTSIRDRVLVGTFYGDVWTPRNITLGHNNAPWITAPDEDIFGLHRPGTLALWRWRYLISEQAELTDITFTTSDGIDYIWLTEANVNHVGLLLTTLNGGDISFREASLPTVNSNPQSIAVDSANHAWITASGVNTIVEWLPPYFFSTYLPLVLR